MAERLRNVSLLPTCGTIFHPYESDWKLLYSEDFTDSKNTKISASFRQSIALSGFQSEKSWGETIEGRGSQITYSALGQKAPLEEKKKWDPVFTKREAIKNLPDKLIPDLSVRLGGATSNDVAKHGIAIRDDFHWRCRVPER